MRKDREKNLQELLKQRFPFLDGWIRGIVEARHSLSNALQRLRLRRPIARQSLPAYSDHPLYQQAVEFRKEFTPKDDCEYAWTIDFAKESYKELDETFRYLDEKADAIIKYMGGGTAAVTIASLMTISHTTGWLPFLFIPSIVFALRAIYHATQARAPTTRPNSPPVWQAIRYADFHDKKAEATFLGLWNQCCEGLAIVNEAKANKVGTASREYFRAILCLLIPLVVWPSWTALMPQPPPKPTQIQIIQDVRTGAGPAGAPR